eukprot:Nk52_evm1s1477 gene=Nk52_evmTU1s1477
MGEVAAAAGESSSVADQNAPFPPMTVNPSENSTGAGPSAPQQQPSNGVMGGSVDQGTKTDEAEAGRKRVSLMSNIPEGELKFVPKPLRLVM